MALESSQPFVVTSDRFDFVGVPVAGGFSDVREVDVTAPVDGQIAAVASGAMLNQSPDGQVVCRIEATDSPLLFGESVAWEPSEGPDLANLSASRVVSIGAGETKTVTLACALSGGPGGVNWPHLMATFTPSP